MIVRITLPFTEDICYDNEKEGGNMPIIIYKDEEAVMYFDY